MPGILAIDQATVTGWAFADIKDFRNWPFPLLPAMSPVKYPGIVSGAINIGSGSPVEVKSNRLREFICDSVSVHGASDIFYEIPFVHGKRQGSSGHGFELKGAIVAAADISKVRLHAVHNQTIKKFFAGTGRAQKADMVRVCERIHRSVETEDEADAVGILCYGAQQAKDKANARKRVAKQASPSLTRGR